VSQTSTPMRTNSEAVIHTFPGHEFSVRWLKHVGGQDFNFTANDHNELITVHADPKSNKLEIRRRDAMSDFEDNIFGIVHHCRRQYLTSKAAQLDCIQEKLQEEIEVIKRSTTLINGFRKDMAIRLSDYVCEDPDMETTSPEYSYDVRYLNHSLAVNVLFDSAAAKIWSIDDFISDDECKVLRHDSAHNMVKASVVNEVGESYESHDRVAEQGSVILEGEHIKDHQLW
jgi:hypothetical protein